MFPSGAAVDSRLRGNDGNQVRFLSGIGNNTSINAIGMFFLSLAKRAEKPEPVFYSCKLYLCNRSLCVEVQIFILACQQRCDAYWLQ